MQFNLMRNGCFKLDAHFWLERGVMMKIFFRSFRYDCHECTTF
jgi:hypothetical protein